MDLYYNTKILYQDQQFGFLLTVLEASGGGGKAGCADLMAETGFRSHESPRSTVQPSMSDSKVFFSMITLVVAAAVAATAANTAVRA
jgi:hypothetical protein